MTFDEDGISEDGGFFIRPAVAIATPVFSAEQASASLRALAEANPSWHFNVACPDGGFVRVSATGLLAMLGQQGASAAPSASEGVLGEPVCASQFYGCAPECGPNNRCRAGEQAAPLVASLTDEQIEALWRKWVGTSRPNYSFARAILATTEAPREPGPALAKRFHDTYERLAPQFGYETRADTRAFDPESPNGKLMIAVCAEILHVNPAAPSSLSAQGRSPCSEPRATGDGELPARAGDAPAEPFWHVVVSKRSPAVNRAIRREDVADEYAQKCRNEGYLDAEVVPLYRASPPAAALQAEPHPDTKDAREVTPEEDAVLRRAASGKVIPHPDTKRLDWLEQAAIDGREWPEHDPTTGVGPWHLFLNAPTPGWQYFPNLRAAIDAVAAIGQAQGERG